MKNSKQTLMHYKHLLIYTPLSLTKYTSKIVCQLLTFHIYEKLRVNISHYEMLHLYLTTTYFKIILKNLLLFLIAIKNNFMLNCEGIKEPAVAPSLPGSLCSNQNTYLSTIEIAQ